MQIFHQYVDIKKHNRHKTYSQQLLLQKAIKLPGTMAVLAAFRQMVPKWKGQHGKKVTLKSNSTVVVDSSYLKESIVDPTAKIIKEFSASIP